MIKEIYILWNSKEDRPLIETGNYGGLCCYLTIQQAQAYLTEWRWQYKTRKEKAEIKKIIVTE